LDSQLRLDDDEVRERYLQAGRACGVRIGAIAGADLNHLGLTSPAGSRNARRCWDSIRIAIDAAADMDVAMVFLPSFRAGEIRDDAGLRRTAEMLAAACDYARARPMRLRCPPPRPRAVAGRRGPSSERLPRHPRRGQRLRGRAAVRERRGRQPAADQPARVVAQLRPHRAHRRGQYIVLDGLWGYRHYTPGDNTFSENYSDERSAELGGDGAALTEFVESIREGRAPLTSIQDAVRTMCLYQAIYDAYQAGHQGLLELPEP
jgi:hypothetical protein